MLLPHFIVWMFSVGMMVVVPGVVSGQNYPNKPMRILTGSAGSGVDFEARLIAQGLTVNMGQQVIVENRPLISAAETVAQMPPDGYTLLVLSSSFWIGPLLQKVRYDALDDFSPIAATTLSPNVLVVHPSVPVKSVKQLIALAKSRPGELNYSSGSAGGQTRLAAELFKAMAAVNILGIPYKGSGPATNALIAGEVQLMFTTPTPARPHIDSGRLRPVAVTSARPSMLFPGLPTVAATVPGYEMVGVDGFFAPGKTPATIINRLNHETVRVLNRADVKEKLLKSGVEIVGSSPEQFAATMKSDIARMGKVIKDANIRED